MASYAHGASGIVDVLLDMFQATGETQHAELAVDAARWVVGQSLATLEDGSGLDWGNGGPFSGLWCYGASGVGNLFIRCAEMKLLTGAERIATAAGLTVAKASRAAPPGFCHGIGGAIDYLLDLQRLTGHSIWLTNAAELGQLMDAF